MGKTDELRDKSPFNASLGRYYCKLSFGKYKRSSPFEKSEWVPDKYIILPLPTNLSDSTTVLYGTADLGAVGDILNADFNSENIGTGTLATTTAVGLRNVGSLATSALGPIGSRIASTSRKVNFLNSLSAMFSQELSATKITSAVQVASGLSPNPNPAVLFQGPHLREFQFSWIFSPKNETESAALKQIIKKLKISALPRNFFKSEVSVLEYPDICQLNFYPWDDDSKQTTDWGWGDDSIIKIKKCVMSSVNVQYNPANVPAFFKDTSPAVIRIDISFKEIEYMLSNDWGGAEGGVNLPDIISDAIEKAKEVTVEAASQVGTTITNYGPSGGQLLGGPIQ